MKARQAALGAALVVGGFFYSPPVSALPNIRESVEIGVRGYQTVLRACEDGLLALADGQAAEGLHAALGTPEWLREFHASLTPHVDSIQFATSDGLVQVLNLQLRDLGINSAEEAGEFVAKFRKLPSERQLSVANGLVFRLLWETRNRLSDEANRARLGISTADFERMKRVMTPLDQKQLQELAIFLLCAIDLPSSVMAERAQSLWENSRNYKFPFSTLIGAPGQLHGVMLAPRDGASLYSQSSLVGLATLLVSLRSEDALRFFLTTEVREFEEQTLMRVQGLRDFPASLKELLEELRGQAMGSMAFAPNKDLWTSLRRAEAELLAIKARIKMLELGVHIERLTPPAAVTSVGENVVNALTDPAHWLTERVSSVVSQAVGYVGSVIGFNINAPWQQAFLAQAVAKASEHFGQTTLAPANNPLAGMQQTADPLVAFLNGLRVDNLDMPALLEKQAMTQARYDELLAQIEEENSGI